MKRKKQEKGGQKRRIWTEQQENVQEEFDIGSQRKQRTKRNTFSCV